ncbi:MAG: diguanylate cyclase [Sulfurospirillaceae bacterium]|nr:diguanylate cyclase [Sulfurospirillaceae bacterium]
MEKKNFKSLFLLYFIVFGIIITLLNSFISHRISIFEINKYIKRYAKAESINITKYILKHYMDNMDNIVSSLARNKILEYYINTGDPTKKAVLQNLFLTLTESNELIMQLRLIDATGHEIIRVNRDFGEKYPYLVKDSKLQDKSSRYYFKIVSKMKNQTLWHSKLDLNIENHKIEIPYRPTIRIALPLFKNRKFVGLLICNTLTNKLFKSIQTSSTFDIFIVDKDGYYIINKNSRYSWNRYTKIKRDLSEDFPQNADQILKNGIESKNLYIYPLNHIFNNEDNANLILKPKQSVLESLEAGSMISSIIIAIFGFLLSIPLAIFISRTPTKLQQMLQDKNTELRRFANIIDEYVITATMKTTGVITSVSKAFTSISHFSKEELIDKNIQALFHEDNPKNLYQDIQHELSNNRQYKKEILNIDKYGKPFWLDQNFIPIKDENGNLTSFITIGIDNNAKKELEKLALVDKLTNLYNRRKIDEYLQFEIEKAKRHNKPLSIIIIDIDYFKKVNDTFGHQIGDEVLKKVAQIMIESTRTSDLCGRFGGEEFIIICTETDEQGALALAEKIRIEIENHKFDKVEHLTASFGISTFKTDDNMETLLNRSDKALYMAKEKGRNQSILL